MNSIDNNKLSFRAIQREKKYIKNLNVWRNLKGVKGQILPQEDINYQINYRENLTTILKEIYI